MSGLCKLRSVYTKEYSSYCFLFFSFTYRVFGLAPPREIRNAPKQGKSGSGNVGATEVGATEVGTRFKQETNSLEKQLMR